MHLYRLLEADEGEVSVPRLANGEVDTDELRRTANTRVNVGCGEYRLAYFINIDSDPTMVADMHCRVPPLPFEDNTMEMVWACHFLEHLSWQEGRAFLQESYRVLRPGGRCGIVVPDTREIVRRWLAEARDCVEFPVGQWHSIADLNTVCALFLFSDAQKSHHEWAYDEGSLAAAMQEAGLVRLREIDRYRDPRIIQGAWYQCGVEGWKP
jgi:predicted SAM-dependent methyltransferase